MPSAELQKIVGTDWDVPSGGRVFINGSCSSRININQCIGSVTFYRGFPVRIPVLGYHIGMSLEVAAQQRPLVSQGWNAFKTLEIFEVTIGMEHDVRLNVGVDRTIHSLVISAPSAVFSGPEIFDRASIINVSEVDYSNANAMLHDWALANSFYETDDSERYAKWLLAQSTPTDWHFAVLNWNYDSGWAPVFWIIRQETCEYATALQLFYELMISEHELLTSSSVAEGSRDDVKLLRELRSRLLSGFYKGNQILFDGEKAVKSYFGSKADSDQVRHLVPAALRRQVGIVSALDTAGPWANGYPKRVWSSD